MPSGALPKIYPEEMVDKVKDLYLNKYMTQIEIAEEIGVTQRVIWRLMIRHGIPARIAAKRNQYAENNHMWKGSEASYKAFHYRVYNKFGNPKFCCNCGTTSSKHYDWANMTGNYQDPSDYWRLCRSCHWKVDDIVSNFKKKEVTPDAVS